MRSSASRSLLTALILALLLAPEALLLHQCACGHIVDCCCRSQARVGAACQLHQGAHCPGGSQSVPRSLQSQREPIDCPGTSPASLRRFRLAVASRNPETPHGAVFDRVPDPPVPPPRPQPAT